MARHEDDVDALKGQALIWKQMFAFADSMALRCAVELHIADILHSHPHPLTLSQLASGIASTTSGLHQQLDIHCLARIMRLLVRKGIFEAHCSPSDGGGDKEPLFGTTHASRWLLHSGGGGDGDDDRRRQQLTTLAPMVLMETHPMAMEPWRYFSRCVVEGGVAFKKCHGREIWDVMGADPEFNRVFNDGMACTATVTMRAVTQCYRDGLARIGSLVDVGGGTGAAIAEVVKAFPHVRGINFDLPHVIATAPEIPGVLHVGGDMFREVPKADAVFMKWIMHDWDDKDCVKILKNCRRSIPAGNGKVIVVDTVLKPDGDDLFDETGLVFDLVMVAHSSGGKERTEPQWKKIFDEAGFPRYTITRIPALPSIIEAYPH